jgi:diadenosine tetraphosphate (Ap4A) HIT family hydrolase
VTLTRRTFCSDSTPGLCDASGLCEAVDLAALKPESSERCYAYTQSSVGLVDINPIAVGHLLVTPRAHLTSTAELEQSVASEVWTFASSLLLRPAPSLEAAAGVLLEHGVTADFPGPACVRHAHVHACPVGKEFGNIHAVRTTLESLTTGLRSYSTLSHALSAARTMDSYLLATTPGNDYLLGVPSRSIPQVTRIALGIMNRRDLDTLDWALNPAGQLYRDTLRYLNLSDSNGSTPNSSASRLHSTSGASRR